MCQRRPGRLQAGGTKFTLLGRQGSRATWVSDDKDMLDRSKGLGVQVLQCSATRRVKLTTDNTTHWTSKDSAAHVD